MKAKQQLETEQPGTGIPICGGNLETPVIDTSMYVDEIHYRVGDRLYIENAD
jgi:hypothetical protein